MKYLLVIVAIALLWGGGQGLYTAVTNSEPTAMSCEEFLKKRPDSLWFKLVGCPVNLAEGMYKAYSESSTAGEVYVPVRSINDQSSTKTSLVVVTEDKQLLAVFNQVIAADRSMTAEQMEKWIIEHAGEVFQQRDFEGVIQFGIDLSSDEREQIAGLAEDLTSDFVILDDGTRPELMISLIMFAGGLLLVGLFVMSLLKRRSSGQPPAQAKEGEFVPPTSGPGPQA